jgi:hypothetical protein
MNQPVAIHVKSTRLINAIVVRSALVLMVMMSIWISAANTSYAHPGEHGIDVTIGADDFSFDIPTELEPGFVEFTLRNDGKEDHHAQLLRLNDGVSEDDLLTAIKSDGEAAIAANATLVGGPALTSPGHESKAIVELAPGNYVVLCLVPSPDGTTHLEKGMIQSFAVEGESQGEPPQADHTITMLDFAFEAPPDVAAGEQVWEVVNDGQQPHELVLLKLDEGRTFAEFMEGFGQGDPVASPEVPSPSSHDHATSPMPDADIFTALGGMQAIIPGATGWFVADLEPGNYVLICFVPDPESGAPHVMLGMVRELTVR